MFLKSSVVIMGGMGLSEFQILGWVMES